MNSEAMQKGEQPKMNLGIRKAGLISKPKSVRLQRGATKSKLLLFLRSEGTKPVKREQIYAKFRDVQKETVCRNLKKLVLDEILIESTTEWEYTLSPKGKRMADAIPASSPAPPPAEKNGDKGRKKGGVKEVCSVLLHVIIHSPNIIVNIALTDAASKSRKPTFCEQAVSGPGVTGSGALPSRSAPAMDLHNGEATQMGPFQRSDSEVIVKYNTK
jgi:hypothetical protein